MSEHPFREGVAVIVQENCTSYNDGTFRDDVVHKVHKSGNFTLKSDPKVQWRASGNYGYGGQDANWEAYRTKDFKGWHHSWTKLKLSNEAAQAERKRAHAKRAHQDRCKRIREFFEPYDAAKRIAPELSEAVMQLIAPPKAST